MTESFVLQYFEHVEEAVWAVEVLKESGKPVAATLCIGPEGDMHGNSPGDCAAKLVKAGTESSTYPKLIVKFKSYTHTQLDPKL